MLNWLFVLNSAHPARLKQAQNVQTSLQNELGSNYTVGNLKATMYESVQQNFATYQTISYIIGGMVLMIAAMLLLNTMLANVSERKREIGILRWAHQRCRCSARLWQSCSRSRLLVLWLVFPYRWLLHGSSLLFCQQSTLTTSGQHQP